MATCWPATSFSPDEPIEDGDAVPDPESNPFDLVSFSMLLAAPRPDELTSEADRVGVGPAVEDQGGGFFNEIACHVPTLMSSL